MTRYVTMPNAAAGLFELEVYRGTQQSAALLGVSRLRNRDTQADTHYHAETGLFISEGHRFVRRVTKLDPAGAPLAHGTWQPLHPQGQPPLEFEKILAKPDLEVQVAAGQNMRDPDGGLIWPVVKQPAPGEQARDRWTGALLFESDGTTPILQT